MPSPTTTPATFSDLALRSEILDELATLGYEEPTPIQLAAIPPALEGKDVLGQAATGTGKTAAFALPVLQRLAERAESRADTKKNGPIALVLVPTRELAMQVSQAVHRYGRGLQARALPIYGGQPIWRQLKELERGVDVVVGTPGRVIDHLKRNSLNLTQVEMVVLDEADEMLDMGFTEDLEAILSEVPVGRQAMLFSATMPGRINKLASKHLNDPTRITLSREEAGAGTGPNIRQVAYAVDRNTKPAALGRVLDVEAPEAAIVFCGTRVEVDQLTEIMNGRGYRAEALHGGMTQEQRDRVMDRLRNKTAELLVATDVAARGLDIDHLTHVVNYDVPSAPESYVHRIGRVGRAGREGTAITLVERRQRRLLEAIERHTKVSVKVDQVPSLADLNQVRRGATIEALQLALAAEEHGDARAIVADLRDEHDLEALLLAAVSVAHSVLTGDADDDKDLPEVHLGGGGGYEGGGKGGGGKGYQGKNPKGGYQGNKDGGSGPKPRRDADGTMARIWVGVGRNAGIRPADLVGAIANETRLGGRDIGAIDITPNFSLVDVPVDSRDEVIEALRNTTIKGKRAMIRPDRDEEAKKKRR